jgi:sucrose phosphorylase
MPVEDILDEAELHFLESCTLESGGKISYKDRGDGTQSPYELNINYQDALASLTDSDTIRIERFVSAETFLISLKGVPGIYIHSLLGSRNNYEEMVASGIPRRINRGSLDHDRLIQELAHGGKRKIIFDELIRRLRIRSEHPALGVNGGQQVVSIDPRLISFLRFSGKSGQEERILVLVNVSEDVVTVQFGKSGVDVLSSQRKEACFDMAPRSCLWLLLD